ncbi:hypothetical protein Bequi_11765 [Brachybacterium sp. JHP9]|uniref:CHAT domain-containing protein n=1 Tax=Brachybacterium equifaecis TaxID=2910770 RepID=A0ABT0R2A8_9MICO|nr:DUF6642 family protein [Brachybacterium equifaecis]MCL6424047.1 hypothetical protein [Brachybacterium equifaecis]
MNSTDRELPGIFCLEGEWSDDLQSRLSVRPLLELLESLEIAQSIHRDVATVGDFGYYLDKWQEDRYQNFGILYLAMHGDRETIHLGGDEVTLAELGEALKGLCAGRVIYFGSCSTMKAGDKELMEFAKMTKARAVVGYRRVVDWTEVAPFELVLLQELATRVRSTAIFRSLSDNHPVMAKKLGLVVATKSGVQKVALRERLGGETDKSGRRDGQL